MERLYGAVEGWAKDREAFQAARLGPEGRSERLFAEDNFFGAMNKRNLQVALALAVGGVAMAIFGPIISRSRQGGVVMGALGVKFMIDSPILIWRRINTCNRLCAGPQPDLKTDFGQLKPLSAADILQRWQDATGQTLTAPQTAKEAGTLIKDMGDWVNERWADLDSQLVVKADDLDEGVEQLGKQDSLWLDIGFQKQYDCTVVAESCIAELFLLRLQLLTVPPLGQEPVIQLKPGQSQEQAIGAYVGEMHLADYGTYFVLSQTYHQIRSFRQTVRAPNANQSAEYPYQYFSLPTKTRVFGTEASLFYQQGTYLNKWRELYNGWCERAKPLLRHFKDSSGRHDLRYGRWSMPDACNDPSAFIASPDNLP